MVGLSAGVQSALGEEWCGAARQAAFTIVFAFQVGVITSYWDTQASTHHTPTCIHLPLDTHHGMLGLHARSQNLRGGNPTLGYAQPADATLGSPFK